MICVVFPTVTLESCMRESWKYSCLGNKWLSSSSNQCVFTVHAHFLWFDSSNRYHHYVKNTWIFKKKEEKRLIKEVSASNKKRNLNIISLELKRIAYFWTNLIKLYLRLIKSIYLWDKQKCTKGKSYELSIWWVFKQTDPPNYPS